MTKKKTYRKSSWSATDDQCLEVANTLDSARDSKNPEIELEVSETGLRSFVHMTKNGTLTT